MTKNYDQLIKDTSKVFINQDAQLPLLDEAVTKAKRIAVDTETHNAIEIDGMWLAVRVISVATRDSNNVVTSYVLDVRDLDRKKIASILAKIEIADCWNANFDDRVLRVNQMPISNWRDGMLTDALLHAGIDGFEFWHGLAKISKRLLGVELDGKGTTQTSYDALTDLTLEQVEYAAKDAIVTLLVNEKLDEIAIAAKIEKAVDLDQRARPFIASMMENGFPFDVEGWNIYLETHVLKKDAALEEIASLTGGPDETLYQTSTKPSFNVDSDPETRAKFNIWAADLVKAYTDGEMLQKTHKLDKNALKQMIQLAEESNDPKLIEQAKLCTALIEYRTNAKVLSTYGDSLTKFVGEDGRIRARYKQGVVATGRLSSDKPNAQNLAPATKKYIKPFPSERKRVFVYADLSQAELRVLAHLASEPKMREMFEKGGDFHALTAGQMFTVDMDALKLANPEEYSNNRKKAKGVNFGIPYGLGAAALANNLTTNSGVKTELFEAQLLLDTYAKTYSNVDKWLKARDKRVKDLSKTPPEADWIATFKLYELWNLAESKKKALKKAFKKDPTPMELSLAVLTDDDIKNELNLQKVELTDVSIANYRKEHAQSLAWAFSYDAPVVLTKNHTPLAWESRTVANRRRLFTVAVDSASADKFSGVLTSAMLRAATTYEEKPAALREQFAAEHNLDLPKGINRSKSAEQRRKERVQCVKAFEGANKPLKYKFVKMMINAQGPAAGDWLLNQALGDQIRGKANAYRNAPIQGSVGDIVLNAFANIWEMLKQYPGAYPVQSVHDSLTIECYEDQSKEIAQKVKKSLEEAMLNWCPTVPAKADCDIRTSLSDEDVVEIS